MAKKFKFNKKAEPTCSTDLYYDFFLGGYMEPKTFLADKSQIKELEQAKDLIQDYLDALEEAGLLEIG